MDLEERMRVNGHSSELTISCMIKGSGALNIKGMKKPLPIIFQLPLILNNKKMLACFFLTFKYLKKTTMIKKIILPVLAILILGSCANKFSLVKRKYSKGYYVDMTKNSSSKKNESEKTMVLNSKKLPTLSQADDNKTPEIKNSAIQLQGTPEHAASSLLTKIYPIKPSSDKPLTASAKNNLIKKNISVKPLLLKSSDFKSGKASSDANLIILIILCFLWWLNLIAVYIHDGKKITLNFWITLLLDFTFIGGVIFSLLVVLDIIDLA